MDTEMDTEDALTKYERARILGHRAHQISLGAPLYVDRGDLIDPVFRLTKLPAMYSASKSSLILGLLSLVLG